MSRALRAQPRELDIRLAEQPVLLSDDAVLLVDDFLRGLELECELSLRGTAVVLVMSLSLLPVAHASALASE